MKFNRSINKELQEMLEKQYKEYIKATPMTQKEQRALREWVKDGHSVYENASGVWADGQVPIEFLTVFRDEEYIRQNTKGMSAEETRQFALAYYGWDDDVPSANQDERIQNHVTYHDSDEELPF